MASNNPAYGYPANGGAGMQQQPYTNQPYQPQNDTGNYGADPGMPPSAPPKGAAGGGQAPSAPNYVVTKSNQPLTKFHHNLFSCFSDAELCCTTCWCPCITAGRIAEVVDEQKGMCLTACIIYTLLYAFLLCPCPYSACYRTKLRDNYNIEGTACKDHCTHCWCECCALGQEYKELQTLGFDPKLGWPNSAARRNAGGVPQQQEMNRM